MPHMKPMEVRMKMGAETNNEILKTRWDKVVRRYKLNKDHNVLFFYHERDDGELHLLVEALRGQY
jgi:hypothetical protein